MKREKKEKMKIYRILAVIVAAAMLAGCSNGVKAPAEQPLAPETEAITSAETAAEAETEPETTATEPVTEPPATAAPETTAVTTTEATTAATLPETVGTTESVEPEFTVEEISKTLYARISSNVRSGPSVDYDKVGSLREGQAVTANGRASTGWYRIEFKGGTAYVSDTCVTEEKPAPKETKPTTAAETEPSEPEELSEELIEEETAEETPEEPEGEIITVGVVPNTYSPEYSFIYENGLQYVWEHLDCSDKENLRRVMTTLYNSQSGCDIAYGSRFDDVNEMTKFADQFLFGWPNQRLPLDNGEGYSWIWSDESGMVYKMSDNRYLYSPEVSARMAGEIQAKVDEIVESAPSGTEREIIRYFYDTVIESCDYDATTDNCGTAYGVFFDGKAKCEGYARAIQLLLSRAGFDVVPVTGMANGQHRWNKVRLSDGKWYNLDATWDDPKGGLPGQKYYDYFLISDEEIMQKEHQFMRDTPLFYPPAA